MMHPRFRMYVCTRYFVLPVDHWGQIYTVIEGALSDSVKDEHRDTWH